MMTIAIGIMSVCAVFVTVNPILNNRLKKDIDVRLSKIEEKQRESDVIFGKITTILENLEEVKTKTKIRT